MTVRDLIKELQEMPPDAVAVTYSTDCDDLDPVAEVRLLEDDTVLVN